MPRPQTRARIAAILPAAGASRRMRGKDKLLELIDGIPLLRRSASALCTDVITKTIVVLPKQDAARRQALNGLALSILENPQPDSGMSASLALAMRALPAGLDGVLIHLADMPDITARHVTALCSAFPMDAPNAILRAASGGRPGHPVLFGRAHFKRLARLKGDRGARDMIAQNAAHLRLFPLPGQAALCDLDTPEDWAAYRAR